MGERLAKARAAQHLTQRDLAHILGLGPSTIAMYERGLRTPPGPVLVAMARALRVSAEDLLPAENDPAASGE